MNLGIVTITCRPEPRFADMANAIAGAAGPNKAISWIVIDEFLANGDPASRTAREAGLERIVDKRFGLVHLPPKPSKVRGPWRETPEDLPDQNSARNTGLAVAIAMGADYLLYLDDCTIITQSTIQAALICSDKEQCLRVPIVFKNDIVIPQDGKVSMGESGGMHFVPCKATTAAGGCFGMPVEALDAIGGFDEIYAGAMGKQDLDAFVRAERAGWKWVTTKRCAAIQLAKTHDKASVSRNDEALSGRASVKPWNDLLKDKARFAPLADWDFEEHVRLAKEHLELRHGTPEPLPPAPVAGMPRMLSTTKHVTIGAPPPTDNEPTGVGE